MYITQLIYIIPGQEEVLDRFEDIAIPIIAKYNGKLLFRVRPDEKDYVESKIEKPYEVHLVEFTHEEDFQKFMKDETRNKFLHLKEQSIRSVIMIKGERM